MLLEDEYGMTNVIVRRQVYEQYRLTVRGEAFLLVSGRLAKDDGAVNVIAEEIQPLTVRKAPRPPKEQQISPFRFLKTLRQTPPAAKSWG